METNVDAVEWKRINSILRGLKDAYKPESGGGLDEEKTAAAHPTRAGDRCDSFIWSTKRILYRDAGGNGFESYSGVLLYRS
jgi:hypothetical protein